MAKFDKFSNGLLDNWCFQWPKGGFFAGNRVRGPSIDFAFIVFYGSCDTLFAEDAIVLLNESCENSMLGCCEMANIKVSI